MRSPLEGDILHANVSPRQLNHIFCFKNRFFHRELYVIVISKQNVAVLHITLYS